MLTWILNGVYLALAFAASPFLAYRWLVLGKQPLAGWRQKLLGLLPPRTGDKPCVWFHAVSVGEVVQLQPVLARWRAQRPDWDIVVSTTTATGHGVARARYPDVHLVYLPMDFSWAVRRALARLRPTLLVLVELELWPNLLRLAASEGVTLALINGRISDRSYRGYRRIRPLLRSLLGRFAVLAVQSERYAERLRDLGAPSHRIHVSGSIKFDGVETNRQNARTSDIGRAFGLRPHERLFIAGSTQAPEEELALESYLELRGQYPDLRLLLVPRHKERFDEVAAIVKSRGLRLIRRSEVREGKTSGPAAVPLVEPCAERTLVSPPGKDDRPILLLDTLGELGAAWGLADVAFVGGSLTRRGGQNMLEPAGYGAAVLFGPNTQNFRDIVEMLLSEGAARVVVSGVDLTRQVAACLAHPQEAADMGRRAQSLVLSQQGAATRTVDLLLSLATIEAGIWGKKVA